MEIMIESFFCMGVMTGKMRNGIDRGLKLFAPSCCEILAPPAVPELIDISGSLGNNLLGYFHLKSPQRPPGRELHHRTYWLV